MTSAAFERAFKVVVGEEGGFDAEPADPGNWTGGRVGAGTLRGTKYGISAAAYPGVDIASLATDAAKEIYLRDYWQPVAGDSLHPVLALIVFDAAVNNGVSHAARWLQIAVDAHPDGVIGPATLDALQAVTSKRGGAVVCAEFMAQRTYFMAGLPGWRTFGLGWSRRLAELPFRALAMPTS